MVMPASQSPSRSTATSSARGSTRNAPENSEESLEADRRRRLQDLPGWTWDTQADKWEEGFRRLLDYVERHGDACPTYHYKIDGYPLGQWVVGQRSLYVQGRLDTDRQRRLQDLPGWTWDPYARQVGGRVPPAPGLRRQPW